MVRYLNITFLFWLYLSRAHALSYCEQWAQTHVIMSVNKGSTLSYYIGKDRPIKAIVQKNAVYIAIEGQSEDFPNIESACKASIIDLGNRTQQEITIFMHRFNVDKLGIIDETNAMLLLNHINGLSDMVKNPQAMCHQCNYKTETLPIIEDLSKSRPQNNIDTGALSGESPYELYTRRRSSYRANGKGACYDKIAKTSGELLEYSSWGSIGVKQMPSHVYQETKKVFQELQSRGVKLRNHVTPEAVACIAMYENRGNLNPFRINYTYCAKSMSSTAVGLGQVTKTTLGDAFNQGEFPIVTAEAKRLLSNTQDTNSRHNAISSSPRLQLEAATHVLNLKSRYAKSKASLGNVIARYDQDGKSQYVSSVKQCISNIKNGKDLYSIFRNIEQ